jgi:hypothetical protein
MSIEQTYPSQDASGRERTQYAVTCLGPFDLPGNGHGLVYLTKEEYIQQLDRPDSTWRCPICHYDAIWDDDNYEDF